MPSDHFIDRIDHFGPYAGSFTTAEDVPVVLKHMKDKAFMPAQSKRDAVYGRKDDIVEEQVANGFCFKVERLGADDEERKALGGEKKLVAITMAYRIGVDEEGIHRAIPIRKAFNGHRNQKRKTWEVGSSLYNKDIDLPNKSGLLPKGGFYDAIVGASTMNLLERAEEAEADSIIANVQSRLTMIIERLTSEPLYWAIVGAPAAELETLTSDTTQGDDPSKTDDNFANYVKQYYTPTPDTFPHTARFLYNAYSTGAITYDRGNIRNVIDIDLSSFSANFVALLSLAGRSESFFRDKMSDTGLIEIRKQLDVALPTEDAMADVVRNIRRDGNKSTFRQGFAEEAVRTASRSRVDPTIYSHLGGPQRTSGARNYRVNTGRYVA